MKETYFACLQYASNYLLQFILTVIRIYTNKVRYTLATHFFFVVRSFVVFFPVSMFLIVFSLEVFEQVFNIQLRYHR